MAGIYEVEILHEGDGYTLRELCQRINLEEAFVVQCVDYGIAEVVGASPGQWQFSPAAIPRLQRAWRLQRDLDINFTGMGVALNLLDDIEDLRRGRDVGRKKLRHWEP